VADGQFDVSDSTFQDEFSELSEPHSSANYLAVFAAKCEKRGFGVRALMVDRIIMQYIVGDALPAESAVLNHRFNSFSP